MTALAHVGGPLGCFGLAVLLVARPRLVRLAGVAALGLGVLFLAVYLAPRGHHLAYVAAGIAGVVVAIAGAVVLRRWPWALALLTLLLAPARVPVTVGSTEANLLIPLYVVVAAAGALLAWELIRDGDERSRELGPVAVPLALFVAWTGLSLSWTIDLKQGAVQLLFFYLPFGLLAISLARLPWRPRLAPVLYLELAAMAVLFAAVGLYQRAAHHVFWNPKVIVGNAYQSFFRVNSLFWDPSIYGRFLVIAILASVVVVLACDDARARIGAAAIAGISWAGLFFSYSQSSFAALLVGVVVAAGYALRPRPAAAAAVAAIVLTALAGVHPATSSASPPLLAASSPGSRASLVKGGIKIALDHPLGGVGIGGFTKSYAERHNLFGLAAKKAASHTTPVTVAAETGVPGFLLFCWLGVAALLLAFRRASLARTGVAELAFGLTLLAIFVHSLGYNALFEDPMTWGALGLAACVVAARPERAT